MVMSIVRYRSPVLRVSLAAVRRRGDLLWIGRIRWRGRPFARWPSRLLLSVSILANCAAVRDEIASYLGALARVADQEGRDELSASCRLAWVDLVTHVEGTPSIR